MTETRTPTELLIVAIQDLHDGACAWHAGLPDLARAMQSPLQGLTDADAERGKGHAATLADLAAALDAPPQGAPNIWLRGILDDARRDARTIVAGPLRDIALAGALRKGKQSQRVSYETAMGLAESLDLPELEAALTRLRDEAAAADAELAGLLADLLGAVSRSASLPNSD